MKSLKRQKFIEAFKAKYPNAWYRTGDFFDDGRDVLWTGEDCWTNEGLPLFDYYNSNYDMYDIGVLNELGDLAEAHGYYFEAYDPGTFILYEI